MDKILKCEHDYNEKRFYFSDELDREKLYSKIKEEMKTKSDEYWINWIAEEYKKTKHKSKGAKCSLKLRIMVQILDETNKYGPKLNEMLGFKKR